MSFFSVQFILFFLVVFIIYYAVSCRYKENILLAASIVFYACFDLKYTLILLLVTILSFFIGKRIDEGRSTHKKALLFIGISTIVLILIMFKFWSYVYLGIIKLFYVSDISNSGAVAIIAPIGISFFTLEAIGYMVDIFNGTISAEENFLKYSLYIMFFPKVMSGPIERSTNLLKQIHNGVRFSYEKVRHGFLMILWGSYIKLLIANRLAAIVNAAFANYQEQTGFTMLIAIILYGIQLYVDFSGYSYMAIGMAGVFGYDLLENFRQPYFSVNIKEFWRRWHISLSSWLRDYIYIPLGGNKKGNLRRYVNLMVTFWVSGLWHGTGLHFVVWGLIHGIYQVCSAVTEKVHELRHGVTKEKDMIDKRFSKRLINAVMTFVLVDFAWLFFRAESVGSALEILKKIVLHPEVGRTIYEKLIFAGIEIKKGGILVFELLLLFVVDICHEKQMMVSDWIDKQEKWFRWCIYLSMAICIIIGMIRDYGIDASTFIYANF